jgi:hypothetical protein
MAGRANAESTSSPERASNSSKKMLRKWVMTTHHGKKSGIGSAPQQVGQNRVKRAHRRLPVGVRV